MQQYPDAILRFAQQNKLITTGPPVDIKNVITPTGCRQRTRSRRSSLRRQLRQSAKACLQANVSTLVKAVETVRRAEFYRNHRRLAEARAGADENETNAIRPPARPRPRPTRFSAPRSLLSSST